MLVSHLINATITGTLLLNNVMERMKMPTQEFSQNDLVAFEVPPLVETQSFERKFTPSINHIHSSGPHIAVLVQPCLRPKRQRPLWMHRWNAMGSKPFASRCPIPYWSPYLPAGCAGIENFIISDFGSFALAGVGCIRGGIAFFNCTQSDVTSARR